MPRVVRAPRNLVYRYKGREGVIPVPELHVLHQDGMSFAEHFYLGGRERHASDGTFVENLVFRKDEFQSPALGTVLECGIEFLACFGSHTLHFDRLSLLQQPDLLCGKFDPAHFLRDVNVLLTDGNQLVGALVDGNQTGGIFTAAQVEFRHTPHVAGLTQVLLVLLVKVKPEIRTFQLRFLAYAVNGQSHLSVLLRDE